MFTEIVYDQITKGENTGLDPRKIDDAECVLAQNFEYHEDGDLRSRTGAKRVNVSNPTLTHVGSIVSAPIDEPRFMLGYGDYVFVSDVGVSPKLLIIDVSDADRAHIVGSYAHGTHLSAPGGIAYDATNDYLYVLSDQYVVTLDVSEKTDPVLLSAVSNAALTAQMQCVIQSGYLYTTDRVQDAVGVWDLTDPTTPAYSTKLTDATHLNGATGIVVDETGDYLWVAATDQDELTVVDISTPGAPSLGASSSASAANYNNLEFLYYSPGSDTVFATAGPTNFTSKGALVAFNTNSYGAPLFRDNIQTSEQVVSSYWTGQIAVIGGYAYIVTMNSDRITIVDVSDPAALAEIGRIEGANIDDNVSIVSLGSNKLITGSRDDNEISVFTISPSVPPVELDSDDASASISSGKGSYVRVKSDGTAVVYHAESLDDGIYRWAIDEYGTISAVEFSGGNATYMNDVRTCFYYENNSKEFLVTYAWNSTSPYLAVWDITSSFDLTGVPTWSVKLTSLGSGTATEQAWVGQLSDGKYYLVAFFDTDAVSSSLIARVWDIDMIGTGLLPGAGYSLLDDGTSNNVPWDSGGRVMKAHGQDYLFFGATTAGGLPFRIGVLNLTDPTAPTVEAGWTPTSVDDYTIHPTQDYIYTIDADDIYVYDVSDPTSVTLVDTITLTESITNGIVALNENILLGFLSSSDAVTALYLNPESPIKVGYLSTANLNNVAMTTCNYDFDAGIGLGLTQHICPAVWESAKSKLTTVSFSGIQGTILSTVMKAQYLSNVRDMASSSTRLYVAANADNALTILDIEDAADPVRLGELVDATNFDSITALYYDEDADIVITVNDGANKYASVVDVSDPTTPVILGSVNNNTVLNGAVQICRISSRYYAIAGSGYNGIGILDINDTANPAIVGSVADATYLAGCAGVATDGTTLWATSPGNTSIQPVDISTIGSPTIAGTTVLQDATKLAACKRLRYYNGYVYTVGTTNDYLYVADVATAPLAPTEAYSETHAEIDSPQDIWVDGINSRAFVTSAANDSIVSYNIADPEAPVRSVIYSSATIFDSPGYVHAAGGYVYGSVDGEDRIIAVSIDGFPLPFPISSIFQFNSVDGSRHTIVTAGAAVYEVNLTTGAFTNITGTKSLPANAEWHWTNYDGVAVGVNGGGTGIDNPVYWDGIAASISTLTDAPSGAQYIELFNHRAVASDGYTLYWSKLGDITDWSDPILSGATEIDADYDGDITGLVAHKGFLIIFKENNVWRLLPGTPNTDTDQWSIERVISGHGCINGSSARAVLDDVFFLSKEGLLSLGTMLQVGDYETSQVSDNIVQLEGLRTDDRYPSVVDPVHSQYWISLPSSGNTTDNNDITFVMDFSDIKAGLKWTRFTGDMVGECYATGKDDDNDVVVFIGGYNDLFVRKKTTDTNPYSDDTSGAIDYDFLSKETDFGLPFKRKTMNRFGCGLLKLTSALTVSFEIRFNGSSSAAHTYSFNLGAETTGDDIEILRKLIGAAGKNALSFQYRLRVNTANNAFGINALTFEIAGISKTRVNEV